MFYQNDGYGESGLDGINVALWNQGFVLHSRGTYETSDGNVTSGVTAMAAVSPPQAVFVFATLAPAADFVCMAQKLDGWEDVYFYLPSAVGPDVIDLLGEECAYNVMLTSVFPDPTNTSVPVIREFGDSLARSFNGD